MSGPPLSPEQASTSGSQPHIWTGKNIFFLKKICFFFFNRKKIFCFTAWLVRNLAGEEGWHWLQFFWRTTKLLFNLAFVEFFWIIPYSLAQEILLSSKDSNATPSTKAALSDRAAFGVVRGHDPGHAQLQHAGSRVVEVAGGPAAVLPRRNKKSDKKLKIQGGPVAHKRIERPQKHSKI